MSASALAVGTAEGNRLSAPMTLPSGKGTQYIHSTPGQRILLSDAQHSGQPARMAMKRHGKNLLLTVPGEDEPRLVIYDFYENNARLQGIGEDGRAHDWVSADSGEATSDMDDGESAFLMLSSDAADSAPLFVPEHNSGAWMAMAAFAGLLGLGGIVRAMQNQHSGPGESPPPPPQIAMATDVTGIYTGALAHGGVTDDARPQLTGSGSVPGELITVYADGVAIGSTLVAGDGSWTFRPDAALSHGLHTFTTTATAASGLVSQHSPGFDLDVDLIAPARPQVVSADDAIGSLTGALASGDVTDDARPLFSGQAEPGAVIVFMLDGAVAGSATVAADGSWQWRPDAALPDGRHSFTAQATDPAGNTGLPSIPFTFTVDTVIAQPLLETVTDAVTGGVEGAISNDETGLTNDARPVLSGRAEAGSLVTIYDGGSAIGSVRADAETGAWRWQGSEDLAEGVHTLTAGAVDPAGNISVISDGFTITVDTLIAPPLLETVTDAVSGGVEGAVSNDGTGLTNDARPLLSGSAEKGSLVTIYDGTTAVGSVYADVSTGAWSWQYSGADEFDEGSHTLSVQAVDPAGNVSVMSDSFTITVDTLITQPVIATVTDAVSGGTVGAIANDGTGLTNDARPLLNGTAEKGSLITIYDGINAIGSVYADAATGAWSWQFTGTDKFAEGIHTLTVQAIDPAGNVSVVSDSFTITVDTLIAQPVLATVTDVVAGGTVGAVASDGTGLTNDTRPLLGGTAEAGNLVTIYAGTTAIGSVYADSTTGAWSWQYTGTDKFAEGMHTLTVQATDPAGNTSVLSESFVITVDTQIAKPVLATVTDSVTGGTVGPITSDGTGLTNDARPLLSGSAEKGSLVTIYDGTTAVGSVYADSTTGAWSWQYSGTDKFEEGAHTLTVQAVDPAGNTSVLSESFVITVDTQIAKPVLATVIDSVTGGTVGPIINDGTGLTNDARPLLSGSAEKGSLVTIYDGTTAVGSVYADSTTGVWSWQYSGADKFDEGAHTLTVQAIDPAGNIATGTDTFALNVDSQAPDAAKNITLEGPVPTLSGPDGSVEAHAVVLIMDGTTQIGSAQADENGKWTWKSDSAPVSGDRTFSVVVQDAAGNLSENNPSFGLKTNVTDFTNDDMDGWVLRDHATNTKFSVPGQLSIDTPTTLVDQSGDFLWKDIIVKAGETYHFSFDVYNALNLANGILGVNFNGDNVIPPTSLDTIGQWITLSGSWTATADGSVRITMFNNQSENWGNDFSLDNLILSHEYTPAANPVFIYDQGSLSINLDEQHLDFSQLSIDTDEINHVELEGHGNNTLALSLGDVHSLGGDDLFLNDGMTQMMITGNAGDVVNLSDLLPDGSDVGDWNNAGDIIVGGVTYQVYQHSGLDADLLVQQNVTVNLDNH